LRLLVAAPQPELQRADDTQAQHVGWPQVLQSEAPGASPPQETQNFSSVWSIFLG
jgi:hypothetical protein